MVIFLLDFSFKDLLLSLGTVDRAVIEALRGLRSEELFKNTYISCFYITLRRNVILRV